MTYAIVKNDTVTDVVGILPQVYIFADGTQTGNFDLLDNTAHIAEGYYPLVENKPVIDDSYQDLIVYDYTIDETSVTRNWSAKDKDLDTLKANKCSDIQSLRRDKLNACVAIGENPFSSDAIFLKSKEKCDDVMALTTAQTVVSYDIAAGW